MSLIIFKKHDYIRSKKLLQVVAQLPCQHCGLEGQTQAAHTNWGHGKGRGIKADDNMVAALCQTCHAEIDQGAHMSKEERQEMWERAHFKTVKLIKANDNWPLNVPYPESYYSTKY